MTLETLIQFRRHWRAIDMLLEREINQMQDNKEAPCTEAKPCPLCIKRAEENHAHTLRST